ncbi:cytochrome P450 3A24 [Cladorrhinum sp. PSN332]|nr:cytochrome P450 3A24 [Cladorrhinum sp. PSN332]
MFESLLGSLPVCLGLLGVVIPALILFIRKVYPKPYPGIPYNEASRNRMTGDLPDLITTAKAKNEFSESIFQVTTQKLGVPIAQLLFPAALRKPMIVLEDAREIEDILVRRNKEFDKAPMALDIFGPMFPMGTIGQYTTPELRAQKRLWADVMATDFLRKVGAPNIHKSTLELVELWKLKAETINQEEPLNVHDDFKCATLDAVWVAVVGEEPGTVRYEIKKFQNQLDGNKDFNETPPIGSFLKEQVQYVSDTIAKNSNAPSPKLAQMMETYTPRYRKFRSIVGGEMKRAIQRAMERYQGVELGDLEKDSADTCAMHLVLRRQILQARKDGVEPTNPTADARILDEMFVMLVGGHDSTANTLAWFVRFMEAWPAVQAELRAILKAAFPGPSLPSASEILDADLPYLDATVEEAFRLSGTVKANLRQALVDTEILGCRIPKGAEIFMNYHINRAQAPVDESKRSESSRAAVEKKGDGFKGPAGRDLGDFVPRRWLVKGEDRKETFNAYALPSLALGGGYRGCFGRKLAMMEMRIMVVLLILTFEFSELPDKFKPMSSTEKIFRQPDFPVAKLKVL